MAKYVDPLAFNPDDILMVNGSKGGWVPGRSGEIIFPDDENEVMLKSGKRLIVDEYGNIIK